MSSHHSNSDIKTEIQSTLVDIYDLGLKIQREFNEINEIVREKGVLDVAVSNACDTLSTTAEKMGLDIANIIQKDDSTSGLDLGGLSLVTSEMITNKLLKDILNQPLTE
ncbi:uncharacterized protein LOC105701043 [Orussus abietinus]|uniref:uncharacterized protein LOC105701043 n=1 Tax=Orussus abietinus TaxID=222816 RepID=UPI0006263536|nr:uncharacterized protein LOC105701043 [Orussus abietinus]